METIKECIGINSALNGDNQLGLKGISLMTNITQGKYTLCQLGQQIKGIIEAHNETFNAIRDKYYVKEDDGKSFKTDAKSGKLVVKDGMKVEDAEKEYEDFLKSDCGVDLKKINVAWLEKIPEITPKHLELMSSVLTENETQKK